MADEAKDATGLGGFPDEVRRLSGGTILIDVRNAWRLGELDYENGLIGDVRARTADLGVADSREWDWVGVHGFRALQAPLLIDSYALEEKVVRGAVVERILQDLEPLGLVGLGVLPGPMGKPLGVRRPLVRPGDYAGMTIVVHKSRVADATMRVLGAKPVWSAGVSPTTVLALDGEVSPNHLFFEGAAPTEKYLTTNVNLWPEPLVVFANRKALEELSPDQRRLLGRAVANVIPDALAELRGDERGEEAAILCKRLTYETASGGELAALGKAVQPIYDDLERDPGTRDAIAAIKRLKRDSPSRPETLPACPGGAPKAAESVTLVDGVWRMTTKLGDTRGYESRMAKNYGTYTFVFTRGRFAFTQENKHACTWGYGTYLVKDHQLDWSLTHGGGIAPYGINLYGPGEVFVFGWSLYRGQLKLSGSPGPLAANFSLKPWRRLSTTPSGQYLSKRCPPPTAARVG
jgi:TRAP-type C4-dicarboxylate transport system substrate-binding protein